MKIHVMLAQLPYRNEQAWALLSPEEQALISDLRSIVSGIDISPAEQERVRAIWERLREASRLATVMWDEV